LCRKVKLRVNTKGLEEAQAQLADIENKTKRNLLPQKMLPPRQSKKGKQGKLKLKMHLLRPPKNNPNTKK
jgi:hypothetical protein